MSAPRVSGRWMAGDANVLSTTIERLAPAGRGALADDRDGGRDVDELEVRVGRALEPDQPGSFGQGFPEDVGARVDVDIARLDPFGRCTRSRYLNVPP